MHREPIRAVLVAIAFAALTSCASDRARSQAAESPQGYARAGSVLPAEGATAVAGISEAGTSETIPVALDPQIDSVWGYLAARYDADGNGSIDSDEYDRDSAQFSRWDRNGDGVLIASDFERRSDRGRRGRNSMKMGMTRRMLARYFQDDQDPGLLPLSEAKSAFARFDGSAGTAADGKLTEGEFLRIAEERFQAVPGDDSSMVQRAMGAVKPWATLVRGLDGDKDGTIAFAEIAKFYKDVMETDTIDYRGWDANGFPGGSRSDGASTDGLSAQEGEAAPDFTLSSPEGDNTFTLSNFRGDRPVALIFGSYT